MTDSQVIRTPLAQRWRRVRYSYMPIVFFILCIFLMLYVWTNHVSVTDAVGTYEQVRADVTAAAEGMLILPVGRQEFWKEHDTVHKGEVLYRIKPIAPDAVNAALKVLQEDLVRIRAEWAAAQEDIQFDVRDLAHDHRREAVRLDLQIEERRLQILELDAEIQVGKVEKQRRENRLAYYRLANQRSRGAVSPFVIAEEELRRDEVVEEIRVNTRLMEEVRIQGREAEKRRKDYPKLALIDMDKLLAPIRQEATTQEARIAELKLQLENLEIKAPFDGTITDITVWPEQHIAAGTVVMTIAATRGRYIVSYVRQSQLIRPKVKDLVTVRVREPGSQPMYGKIEQVGAQYEMVPRDQLRDYRTRETGRPVRIVLINEADRNLAIPPGELLDIGFKPNRR